MTKITKFTVDDVRFPTSKDLTGSDAIHTDPDYSATYVTVFTSDNNLKGFGIAFTIGKGNDIVAACIKHFFPLFIGKTLDELETDIGKLWFQCVDHSQLRWLGPEKGVVHMAVAAILTVCGILLQRKMKNLFGNLLLIANLTPSWNGLLLSILKMLYQKMKLIKFYKIVRVRKKTEFKKFLMKVIHPIQLLLVGLGTQMKK